ncbi:MAG: serine racemase VanT catalytic subunit [Ruminococcus sp.]|jgi:alanine racemase
MYQKNRAWVEINLDHLKNNVRQFQNLLPSGCRLMPAVKADGYGHGALPISAALQQMGVNHFCVASAEEGMELRKAGIAGEILVLGYTHPGMFSELKEYRLTQTVLDYEYGKTLNRFGQKLEVHIGVDTGMHRLGERSTDYEKIAAMWEMKNLKITGVFSHLCVSDGSGLAEREFTKGQIKAYNRLIARLHQAGIRGFRTHLQGSYGVMNYPELQYDLARVGIALYGVLSRPADTVRSSLRLEPVLELKARIACVRDLHPGEQIGYGLAYTADREMKAAVVSVGYADGIPRQMSNRGYALIKGKKAPVIGRVCMDQLFLDVTEIPGACSGEEVVFIGKSGDLFISADMAASWAGTISNELLSRLGKRLKKICLHVKQQNHAREGKQQDGAGQTDDIEYPDGVVF